MSASPCLLGNLWLKKSAFLRISPKKYEKCKKTPKNNHFQNHRLLHVWSCNLSTYVNFTQKSGKLNVETQVNIRLPAGPIMGGYQGTQATKIRPKRFSFVVLRYFWLSLYMVYCLISPDRLSLLSLVLKWGCFKSWSFSISKPVFAANLDNFRLSQQLAK